MGPIYGSHPIGLLYFIGPASKVALRMGCFTMIRNDLTKIQEF
jgi:hypothetical protein